MGPDPEDTRGVYAFPCGAEIIGYLGSAVSLSKHSRARLVVYGSPGAQRPVSAGVSAPCLYDCPRPKRRIARRGFIGNTSEPVTLVTCLATWRFGE
jgi:hypothetical protein